MDEAMPANPTPLATPLTGGDDATPTSSLDGLLGYNLKRTFNALHAHLALTLRPFDLRMVTYAALVVIVENPGLRQAQLADALKIERANAVGIVDELVNRGLVTRERAEYDRRAYALVPTEAGRTLCAEALAADHANEQRIVAGLDALSARDLIRALQLLEQAAQNLLLERSLA